MAKRSRQSAQVSAGTLKSDDVRARAAQVLYEVTRQGHSLDRVLPMAQLASVDARATALLAELCYGTIRWYYRLDAILNQLLERPLRSRDADVHCLLLIGLYQLDQLALPPHAAVHTTVQAAHALGKDWAGKLINAILRNFQRQHEQLVKTACTAPQAKYAHPNWLIERLRADWPADWAAILQANNSRPPFTLRVNGQRLTRNEYLEVLSERSLPAERVPHAPQAVYLHRAVAVSALPGFIRGDVSVQDAAAQLAAGLLRLAPGLRVLDACAAPGGKAMHILESEPGVRLTAVDIDPTRLQRITQNLDRLELRAELVEGDASQPADWWDGHPFARILLDVPCSATGVIRRHPDIKLLRRAEDIAVLGKRQARLLDGLWPLLAPGGMLLYCTCSVLKEENSRQVEAFLARHRDASEQVIDAAWGRGCTHGRQIFPGEDQMDGFYFACIRKIS